MSIVGGVDGRTGVYVGGGGGGTIGTRVCERRKEGSTVLVRNGKEICITGARGES